jgi:hypothetical protein
MGVKINFYLEGTVQKLLDWMFLAKDGESKMAFVETVTNVI